jgi:ligand-binding sensor domain-containing protein
MADGLPINSINALLETRGGALWVATNGGGVCRFNPEADATARFTVYRVGETAATGRVKTLFEDRAGSLWAGTDGGLFRLEAQPGAFVPVALGLSGYDERLIQVWALAEDRQGHLWIATKFGLVERWPTSRMIHHAVQPSASGDCVFSLLLDRAGRLWLDHRTAGALVLTPE